jgi:hypothetical protein
LRHLIICENEETTSVVEAARSGAATSDRTIILSSRRGTVYETGDILNIPIRWALGRVASPSWPRRDRARRILSILAGLRAVGLMGGLKDLLTNIDAADPDIIDLRRLGSFGQWLAPKCALRFPGRKVLTSDETYMRDDTAASWRTYDPTALVSIVLPVHNGARYLSHSIDSCLRQTHTNLELIIVDDGSIDDSSAIIKNYAALDSRIIVLTNKVNEGLPEALNRGFGVANGRFLTWTSDDNWYAPTAIQFMTQQLCTFPDIGLVYCGRHEVDEAGQVNNIYLPLPSTALARDNIVGACFMYRRAVMEVVVPIDENIGT